MTTRVIVKKSTYRDSISLMKVSTSISKLPGITQAAVVMATELNRRVLAEAGFADASIGRAEGDDMIVAIAAKDAASLDAALAETEKLLSPGEKPAGEEALAHIPGRGDEAAPGRKPGGHLGPGPVREEGSDAGAGQRSERLPLSAATFRGRKRWS